MTARELQLAAMSARAAERDRRLIAAAAARTLRGGA